MARRKDAGGGAAVTAKRGTRAKLNAGGPPRPGGRRRTAGSDRTAKGAHDPEPAAEPSHARDFGRRLRAWYRRHARDLPWRRTRDPYQVLVSELMLQQTQVARVVDYYARFLARFPTLRHVAEAEPHHVTAEWAGLGYYARARNLHALARRVHGEGAPGALPDTAEALRALPGIGAYTAGAVASFAFERRAALVDTNVARVLARVFAPGTDVKSGRGQKRVWRIAEAILPRRGADVWTHNQALMELGALVCTARVRRCGACPVKPVCLTNAATGCEEDAQASREDVPAFARIAARERQKRG
jgi:A/G-specific adenine glycosylase